MGTAESKVATHYLRKKATFRKLAATSNLLSLNSVGSIYSLSPSSSNTFLHILARIPLADSMLAIRSFGAPARRQCIQVSSRAWKPAAVQVRICLVLAPMQLLHIRNSSTCLLFMIVGPPHICYREIQDCPIPRSKGFRCKAFPNQKRTVPILPTL